MKSVLITLVIALGGICLAQPQPGPGGFRGGQRVEQFKKLRMIEALKLDEDASVRFFAKYNKHEDILRDINKQRNDLLDKLHDLRESKGADAQMEKVIAELSSLDGKQAEERARFLEDIKTVLSTGQIADLFLFERDFARNIRQLMQEMARGRREGQR
jgi:hypothetical protein